ncbi:DEAD/DEAH box helicase [bacterium]|nr:MAG: DEAD/DEAH box helicase [bacterium]
MASTVTTLSFRDGFLWLDGGLDPAITSRHFKRHPLGRYAAPAHHYGTIMRECASQGIAIRDLAGEFATVPPFRHHEELDPFDFQRDAIKAWENAGRRGMIILPTGAGKSFMTRLLVARLAVRDAACSTLIVVPTRALLYQWHAQLQAAFHLRIGIVGDDLYDLQPITVTTYASARIQMPRFGNRWKLMVFDEVHRKLAGSSSANTARFAVAPYRLGLTATPIERELPLLTELVGPIVFERTTHELIERDVLSVYRTAAVRLSPTHGEVARYFDIRKPMDELWHLARGQHWVRGRDWFVIAKKHHPDAAALALRAVQQAHRYWASIPSRMDRLERILAQHPNDRILIFTESRASAYDVSRRFLIPSVTADIDGDEREIYLRAFASGQCRALVTARALEEGIDLPEANVAVILAGRKKRNVDTIAYIQRRGRILRKRAGKEATVYEVAWSLPKRRAGHT